MDRGNVMSLVSKVIYFTLDRKLCTADSAQKFIESLRTILVLALKAILKIWRRGNY